MPLSEGRPRDRRGYRDGCGSWDHQTGLGTVLLAFSGLERIRRAGYAFDDEEGDLGVRCKPARGRGDAGKQSQFQHSLQIARRSVA